MKAIKITITSDRGHFKKYRSAGLQQTYRIPPVSSVKGMLETIYGEDIDNFIFGYNMTFDDTEYEVSSIHKEVNVEVLNNSEIKKELGKSNPCNIEYLIKPNLEVIVININKEIEMKNVLNMGKTNCLAKAVFSEVEIKKEKTIQENVLTDFKDGYGVVERMNIETKYNVKKGCYDYFTKLFRLNDEYECNYTYEEKGVYLWEYKKVGDIQCYKGQL